MKYKFITSGLLLALLVAGCNHHPKKITDISGERIAIDSIFDAYPDSLTASIINKYKAELNEQLDEVLGKSAHEMASRRPESLLSNFTTDAMLAIAREKSKQPIDFSLMNFGGLRATIPAGNITRYELYTTYPFENTLVFITIKGEWLRKLFDKFAENHKVEAMANVQLIIKDRKIASVKINNEPLDDNKTYSLVTLDFIAQGGDGMNIFSHAIEYEATPILLREAIEEYITSFTAKGKMLDSKLEGRIIIQ